jgi:peptide/nickel transport system permease protein
VLDYALRRLLAMVPVLGVVGLFVFSLLYITPGDPALVIAGDRATPDELDRIRVALGLNEPFLTRLTHWTLAVLRGDLGVSIFSNVPVTELIAQRLEPTLSLSVIAILVAVSAAIPAGALAALYAGRWPDRVLMGFAVLGFSVPVFVISYVLVMVFSLHLEWLPVQGFVSLREGFWPFLSHMILPGAALGSVYMALIARVSRASLLEVMGQDYIRTAKAKGLGTARIVVRHALKNAGVPIATIIGIGIGLLITGVVVTETVFAIPGLGRLVVDAILRRDYPVIQGVILFFAAAYVVVNFLVDLSYTWFDPRITY